MVGSSALLTESCTAAVLTLLFAVMPARAQISDDVVKIGVLNDRSGLYADLGGSGSVVAAQMAVEDFGGKVLGKPIEVVFADHHRDRRRNDGFHGKSVLSDRNFLDL